MRILCIDLTNPEWWSVIATFFAAIVAARITSKFSKRQNELQEQQNKLQERQIRAQEYEVYKRLYMLLGNANREIDNFIEELDWLLWQPWHNSNKDALNRKKTHIDNLFKRPGGIAEEPMEPPRRKVGFGLRADEREKDVRHQSIQARSADRSRKNFFGNQLP